MDEIKEIEERNEVKVSNIFPTDPVYMKVLEDDITHLLSHIHSLESQLSNLQAHADKLGEIISNQTKKRLELESIREDERQFRAKAVLEIAGLTKKVESLEAQLKGISQVMCGRDEFPGDLVQYIKNEVEGRNEAEKQIEILEAQLNVEWDDERVREIKKYWDNLMPVEDGITDNAPILNGKIHFDYLLSLLKKEWVEKKELEEGIKKHAKNNPGYGYTPGTIDYELYKSVGCEKKLVEKKLK